MKSKIPFMYGPYDIRIEEVELPPIKPDEVLIKLKACGICGSDIACYMGQSKEGRYDIAPYTPGHEWAGQAVQVGSAVTSIKPGNKVVGDCLMPCHRCENCKNGLMPSACLNMDEVGFLPNSPGGMGEYMIMNEKFLHVIPDDWDYELGAWVETFNVGYWSVWGNGLNPDASDDCVIIGGGPIGLCAAMTCKASNARVIVIDPIPARRENALNYGADIVIDPSQFEDLEAEIKRLTGGRGASVVIECSGNDKGIASMFDIAAHNARIACVGHSIGRKVPVEIGKVIWKTLKISGSAGTMNWFPRTIQFLSQIKDKYDFAELNTHHFHYLDIKEAFEFASNNKEITRKVMLTFDK
ncbi:alcohol dehydrogenase [Bacillus endophyticus]|uniref:zinc-dependent alcohol dehydrogenase n=1 Tax=Priestia endophytica TaxID=135735 RepID=UPI0018CE8749|nr:zinc-binding dehydrogenase [Priestia endophytica]MBG9813658.1 alcohol dehydrogenase [Priestia endophytica]